MAINYFILLLIVMVQNTWQKTPDFILSLNERSGKVARASDNLHDDIVFNNQNVIENVKLPIAYNDQKFDSGNSLEDITYYSTDMKSLKFLWGPSEYIYMKPRIRFQGNILLRKRTRRQLMLPGIMKPPVATVTVKPASGVHLAAPGILKPGVPVNGAQIPGMPMQIGPKPALITAKPAIPAVFNAKPQSLVVNVPKPASMPLFHNAIKPAVPVAVPVKPGAPVAVPVKPGVPVAVPVKPGVPAIAGKTAMPIMQVAQKLAPAPNAVMGSPGLNIQQGVRKFGPVVIRPPLSNGAPGVLVPGKLPGLPGSVPNFGLPKLIGAPAQRFSQATNAPTSRTVKPTVAVVTSTTAMTTIATTVTEDYENLENIYKEAADEQEKMGSATGATESGGFMLNVDSMVGNFLGGLASGPGSTPEEGAIGDSA